MMEEIIKDMKKREVSVSSFICADKDGMFQLISYTGDGVVSFLSEKVKKMQIYKGLAGGAVVPIAYIERKEKL